MMSEEITKVMDEQRDLELEYAQLVQMRDQLKGISNKQKLLETKEGIMVSALFSNSNRIRNFYETVVLQRVAKELKESTRKLCRQLQKKPDVEGNQREVKRHKKALEDTIGSLKEELMGSLSYNNYTSLVNKEIDESNQFEELKRQEKDLTNKIKKVTEEYRKAQNEYVRETDENNQEISDLKKKVNEADVEAKLHIQYLERQIQGAQSCQDRLYK